MDISSDRSNTMMIWMCQTCLKDIEGEVPSGKDSICVECKHNVDDTQGKVYNL